MTGPMRSGRGRLPGMGIGLAPVPAEAESPAAALPAPRSPEPAPEEPERSSPPAPVGREPAPGLARGVEFPAHAPLAGEAKIQVNPRIYHHTWRRYEELVDMLPRERRRGALTALVNAVLARHAPEDLAGIQAELAWLRRAEVRDS